mmetsp:Transcript_1630/g.3513  ORF Transcript_1630/g.3513 Transcript_1630/m.3513 type:complete len:80 (-) Transcript_1630:156-395(-)
MLLSVHVVHSDVFGLRGKLAAPESSRTPFLLFIFCPLEQTFMLSPEDEVYLPALRKMGGINLMKRCPVGGRARAKCGAL